MSSLNTVKDEQLRYKYLAFFCLRDAISFYFGIPKFLATINIPALVEERLQARIGNEDVTDKQRAKYKRLIEKSINARIAYLKNDYKDCEDVLFTDNLWLQLLDIDADFFKTYLNKLPDSMKDELAIIPTWTIRDDDLSRPYITSQKTATEVRF